MINKEYEDKFLELYNKGLSDGEIGKLLNKTSKCIFAYRKKRQLSANIPYRAFKPEDLISLYNQGLNDTEIGKILNISDNTVYTARVRYGLKSNNPSKNKPIELTQNQKEVLVGTLMGDCSLQLSNKNTYSGKIEHSLKQESYCLYKYEELRSISRDTIQRNYRKEVVREHNYGKDTYSISFNFKANTELKYFYDIFYKTGKKEVSEDVLEFLTPKSLAIWFMDDGTYFMYNCYLCTDSFSKQSNQLLVDWFKNKYGIETSINKRNRLYFKAKTRQKFLDLITPYIHPTMTYKINSKMTIKDQIKQNNK